LSYLRALDWYWEFAALAVPSLAAVLSGAFAVPLRQRCPP